MMSEKLYRVQMNSKGMPDFSTAVEVADRPSAVYEYLKRKIGDTVDSETEFDAWFNRMVWHVEECNRLADKPQGEWIPCSERLPEEREWIGTKRFGTTISDEVLVTFESRGERFVRPIHFQNGELGGMNKHTMDAVHGEWKAVAWMPLPEPWKGADDE